MLPDSDPHDRAEAAISGARVFTLLWDHLVAVLGTAATTTLVRRAARRAVGHAPELTQFNVSHEGFEYQCILPASWQDTDANELPALRELVRAHLCPLLQEFTGAVVLNRLAQIPDLAPFVTRLEEK